MRQVILAIVVFALLTALASYLGACLPGLDQYDRMITPTTTPMTTGGFAMSVGAGCG